MSPDDRRVGRRLIALARPEPRQLVLDLGCGTGALSRLVKRTQPGATVVGVEAGAAALVRARHAAVRAELVVRFDHAPLDDLPYGDGTFDMVLTRIGIAGPRPDPRRTFAETRRVVRAGRSLHAALLIEGGRTAAAAAPAIELLHAAGFRLVRCHDSLVTRAGLIAFLSATA